MRDGSQVKDDARSIKGIARQIQRLEREDEALRLLSRRDLLSLDAIDTAQERVRCEIAELVEALTETLWMHRGGRQ